MTTHTHPTRSLDPRRPHASLQPHSSYASPLTLKHASVIVISSPAERLTPRYNPYACSRFIAHPRPPPFAPPRHHYKSQSITR